MFEVNAVYDAYVKKMEEVEKLRKAKSEAEELSRLAGIFCQHYKHYEVIGVDGYSGGSWWLFSKPMTHDKAMAELKKVYGHSFGEPYNDGYGREFSDGAYTRSTKTRTLVKMHYCLDV